MNKKKTNTTNTNTEVIVGLGSCGLAAGAGDVFDALADEMKKNGVDARLKKTGCIGLCYKEVLIDIISDGVKVSYGNVTPAMAARIVKEHLVEGRPVDEWIIFKKDVVSGENTFLKDQKRIVLRKCGLIDPEDIEEAIAKGGYEAIKKVLSENSPDEVVAIVKESGLRGRGGAGFTTGLKWEFTRKAEGDQKYIICNADEGDPGAYMDRSVLESDPHAVLEGMLIAGYAISADQGYIYCRAEYPLAIKRLNIGIEQARAKGLLGKNILGHDFNFDITIKQGAGAFVCGEETALMASIEGKRGMPRLKPPFPVISGLWEKPTCINNVETLANISWIILNGAAEYAAIGTERSKGNKVFALTGKIERSGLVEVPMGITLREIIFDIGGGIKDGGTFKAVQIGGPTGGCLPEDFLDTYVDYDSLTKTGATMGSGGMVILDESTCMVDLAKFFMSFAQSESCGKCVPCRLGTKRMLEILERITQGIASAEELDLLESLAVDVKMSSLCGLGQTAPNPILTTIKYFRDEYLSHIHDKTCPAKVCVDLIDVVINQDLCRQCAVCIKHCPVQAISGARHEYTVIDPDACIGCRMCISVCPWNTIDVDSPKQLIVPAEKYRRPVNKENVAESVRCKADESRGGGA